MNIRRTHKEHQSVVFTPHTIRPVSTRGSGDVRCINCGRHPAKPGMWVCGYCDPAAPVHGEGA